jgi:Family of unknown function (DUF6355)
MHVLKRLILVTAVVTALVSMGLAPAANASEGVAAEPAATGESTINAPCGAYIESWPPIWGPNTLMYRHCGPHRIRIEIDRLIGSNWFMCVNGWETVRIGDAMWHINAWYVVDPGPC